jgi:hypothetical protein
MAAAGSSEIFITFFLTICRHTSEGGNIFIHRRQNLQYHNGNNNSKINIRSILNIPSKLSISPYS